MSSIRTQIRQDVVDRLKTVITDVGSRVFNSRPEAIASFADSMELPCICVFNREERAETLNSSPTMQERKLALGVVVMAAGTDDLDEVLDDLCEDVEEELLKSRNQQADGLHTSVSLIATDMDFTDAGRKPVGAARLTFEFSYTKTFT